MLSAKFKRLYLHIFDHVWLKDVTDDMVRSSVNFVFDYIFVFVFVSLTELYFRFRFFSVFASIFVSFSFSFLYYRFQNRFRFRFFTFFGFDSPPLWQKMAKMPLGESDTEERVNYPRTAGPFCTVNSSDGKDHSIIDFRSKSKSHNEKWF
mgnify:CR=1 FL=1